jgi:hypothetical protein
MRFMVILKATKASEAGEMPSEALMTAMIKFNEELVKAGVLLAADGLRPSRDGARIRFNGERRDVTDGPFAETRELVAGYWLIQTRSLDEAIEWMKRAPNPMEGTESDIEIRRMFEMDDFGEDSLTPEARATVERMHAEVASKS